MAIVLSGAGPVPRAVTGNLARGAERIFRRVSGVRYVGSLCLYNKATRTVVVGRHLDRSLSFRLVSEGHSGPRVSTNKVVARIGELCPRTELRVLKSRRFRLFINSNGDIGLSFFDPTGPIGALGMNLGCGGVGAPAGRRLLKVGIFAASMEFIFESCCSVCYLLGSNRS